MPAPTAQTLIDRVDAADRPIGTVRRGEVFEQEAAFRVIHIFVFDPDGALVLQQLGHNRKRNPLRWGSSVAGYLHAGEDYLQAAERRLTEELGLRSPLSKVGSFSMQDKGSRKFITLYATYPSESPVIADGRHIEALRHWPVDEIERTLEHHPERFTPTFRQVFAFYRTTAALTGP